MIRLQLLSYLFIITILSIGCGSADKPQIQQEETESNTSPISITESLKLLSVVDASTPLPADAKIFLVAGGLEDANFSQEVIDQREIFINKLGYKPSEVVCYYVRPYDVELEKDREQYESLADKLSNCYPASPYLVLSHLKQAAKNNPASIYLYVTAHGAEPFGFVQDISEQLGLSPKEFYEKYPEVSEYFIALDSTLNGYPATTNYRFSRAILKDVPNEGVMLNPSNLVQALKEFAPSVKKYVVLQACHSGGFLDSDKYGLLSETDRTLKSVPSIIAMTAARFDRASFGCGSEFNRTYYGGTFTDRLSQETSKIDQINWTKLNSDVQQAIETRELEAAEKPSLPQFFDNIALDVRTDTTIHVALD